MLSRGKRLFIYKRGKLIIAINPEGISYDISIDELKGYEVIYSIGKCSLEGVKLSIGESSFGVFKPIN